jgi:hypothetical protein
VGLERHVGGELPLALGGAVEADRATDILVAIIAGGLGRRIAGLGHGAAVELAGAMSGTDIRSDDALQVDLHGAFAKSFVEGCGRVDDELLVQVADAVAVEDRQAEALGDEGALCGIGAGEPDHLDCGALAERDDAGAGAGVGSFLGHAIFLLRFPEAWTGPMPALPRARTDRTGGMTGASGSGRTEASMEGLRPSRAPFRPRAGRGPAMSRPVRSGRPAARNAALKRTAAGSGPPKARGRTGTGPRFRDGNRMTGGHDHLPISGVNPAVSRPQPTITTMVARMLAACGIIGNATASLEQRRR